METKEVGASKKERKKNPLISSGAPFSFGEMMQPLPTRYIGPDYSHPERTKQLVLAPTASSTGSPYREEEDEEKRKVFSLSVRAVMNV